uniref:Uncharacterized protein n=1 Tax=Spongospora subterranea TaxID=70186 RepID=A0A0H5QHD9_9EUKA|eukprot:CRZ01077.1 hypothetical protein [Spongospora subterranea]
MLPEPNFAKSQENKGFVKQRFMFVLDLFIFLLPRYRDHRRLLLTDFQIVIALQQLFLEKFMRLDILFKIPAPFTHQPEQLQNKLFDFLASLCALTNSTCTLFLSFEVWNPIASRFSRTCSSLIAFSSESAWRLNVSISFENPNSSALRNSLWPSTS